MIKIIPNNNDKKERKYVERERDWKKMEWMNCPFNDTQNFKLVKWNRTC